MYCQKENVNIFLLKNRPLAFEDKSLEILLFSDTEIGENIAQQIIGSDLTCNFTEVKECLSDIYRQKVARKSGIEALLHFLYLFKGFCKRIVVSCISYDGFVVPESSGVDQA